MIQMANPGLDPVNAAEFHVADMLQRSRLLTGTETPPRIPHLASRLIDFRIGAIGSQIATDTSFDPTDPDHVNNAADQLQSAGGESGEMGGILKSVGQHSSGVVDGECGSGRHSWEWGAVAREQCPWFGPGGVFRLW